MSLSTSNVFLCDLRHTPNSAISKKDSHLEVTSCAFWQLIIISSNTLVAKKLAANTQHLCKKNDNGWTFFQLTNDRETLVAIPSLLIYGGSVPGLLVSQAKRQARIFFSIRGVFLKFINHVIKYRQFLLHPISSTVESNRRMVVIGT
jgi:hypothetical protein